jgi:hypothetical protein
MGKKRNEYGLLVRKAKRKRTLGRPRHRWMDNVNMDIVEIGLCGVDYWSGSD